MGGNKRQAPALCRMMRNCQAQILVLTLSDGAIRRNDGIILKTERVWYRRLIIFGRSIVI
jgi:hypothetical protein